MLWNIEKNRATLLKKNEKPTGIDATVYRPKKEYLINWLYSLDPGDYIFIEPEEEEECKIELPEE